MKNIEDTIKEVKAFTKVLKKHLPNGIRNLDECVWIKQMVKDKFKMSDADATTFVELYIEDQREKKYGNNKNQ